MLECWAQREPVDLRLVLSCTAQLLCSTNPDVALRDNLARVLLPGSEKYGAWNWRRGTSWSRYVSAALRHWAQYEGGHIYDHDTGLHHLAHFSACVMFLAVYERDGIGIDDRQDWGPSTQERILPRV